MESKKETEPIFRHHIPVQMHFADIDILGHVNNGAYLQYMDLAKVRYFSETLGDTLDWHKETLVVANINCTFMAPTFWGEEIEVATTVESISVHSLVLLQRVVDTRTGATKCECRSVMVGFDPRNSTALEIPDSWRRLFSTFEQRPFQTHAAQ